MNNPEARTIPAEEIERSNLFKKIRDMGQSGKSQAQIARKLDISLVILEQWIKADPEFAEVMKEADDLALAWWENQLQKQALSRSGNATLITLVLKTRFESQYGGTTSDVSTETADMSAIKALSPKGREKLRKLLQKEQGL